MNARDALLLWVSVEREITVGCSLWHRLPAFLYPTSFGPPRACLECRKDKPLLLEPTALAAVECLGNTVFRETRG